MSGTGIYGKNAVAEKILAAIPSREELLKRLESPYVSVREQSQFLLSQQSNALLTKREFEQKKFREFLEDQKTAEFGKNFVREQIGLVNNSGLTGAEKAKRRLSITDALGNDLDAGLKRQRIKDFAYAANDKRNQAADALQYAKDTRDAMQAIVKALAGKGIKVDLALPAASVNVYVKTDNGTSAELAPAPTAADTSGQYYSENHSGYRIGDVRKAGQFYGARIK